MTYTPEEVRYAEQHPLVKDHPPIRQILLSYAALLEAMEEAASFPHFTDARCVEWLRQRAAEILEAKR